MLKIMELMFVFPKSNMKERIESILAEAMRLTNNELKLNVKIAFSAEYGQAYGKCH